MTKVNLSSNSIGSNSIKDIISSLPKELTGLDLSSNEIDAESLSDLARSRSFPIKLAKLDLSNNKIGKRGCNLIASLIQRQPTFAIIPSSKYNVMENMINVLSIDNKNNLLDIGKKRTHRESMYKPVLG